MSQLLCEVILVILDGTELINTVPWEYIPRLSVSTLVAGDFEGM